MNIKKTQIDKIYLSAYLFSTYADLIFIVISGLEGRYITIYNHNRPRVHMPESYIVNHNNQLNWVQKYDVDIYGFCITKPILTDNTHIIILGNVES